MRKLYVLFDGSCGLCVRSALWLSRQPAYFDIEPLAAGSQRAHTLFPGLSRISPDELFVIADTGEMYEGVSAWLMCLYALKKYRVWSFRLSRPAWRPLAKKAISLLSQHRKDLSRALGWSADRLLSVHPAAGCEDGTCRTGAEPLLNRVQQVRRGG
jgi:predicted DCC family thiol-disulfide oxidoreductase YuxK